MNVSYGVKLTVSQETLWDLEKIHPELSLSEDCNLGEESLNRVIHKLETLFGINLDPESDFAMKTVGDLEMAFQQKLRHTQI
ncbi:hypothetical protein [Persicobacter psychrovividus]|uniref:Acyl carrier protein n=1 Tax=Persicobacter psychrovividus TaxID=387638 RepID=A0ABM7VFJ5_9BACT|nr:hypothetical protein PEPS_19650 [Persicobacter psychrovividus]